MTLPGTFDLPVAEALPRLDAAMAAHGAAVLVAPPGAGKTTLVPLHLMGRLDGRIILVEPRRIAARAAARRMAALLGEDVGRRVGQAMRLDTRQGPETRILVVTEGVFSRMVLDDPELAGIAAVIFDEFHERSLDADFGLALALDVRGALRPDLKLLVMSATLDGAAVARLLGDAPVVESLGRAYPVTIRHEDRPGTMAVEEAVAGAVLRWLKADPGSQLVFLPGMGEIARVAARLEGRLPPDCDLHLLHGTLSGPEQDAAIRPPDAGRRKVVLSSAIAESAVTIDGVSVVIDCGLARVPAFEPATGLTRLDTVRVSKAAADQRAGRAGRTRPGIAVRLWHEGQTAALKPHDTPEILSADLSGLLLDCAAFGVTDPASLAFLDAPPAAALAEARKVLVLIGAFDADGRITELGERMRALPLPARLAAMVAKASGGGEAADAATLAVLLTERGLGGNGADLAARALAFARERGARAEAAKGLVRRLSGGGAPAAEPDGSLLALAFPDRVAKPRGAPGRFVMANGRGATVEPHDPLAKTAMLVIADVQGQAANPRITAAIAVGEDAIRRRLADRIDTVSTFRFDTARRALVATEVDRIGRLDLVTRPGTIGKGKQADRALADAVREAGLAILSPGPAFEAMRARLAFLHARFGAPWPPTDDEALLAGLDDWLVPVLDGSGRLSAINDGLLARALAALVPWDMQRELDRLAPTHMETPAGSRIRLDYRDGDAVLAVRVQELFGLTQHPCIADGHAVLLELLSPAHRPIQTTRDLPAFWTGSWADVRSDMRGRYPKHVWPDNPAAAMPTTRAKPRGT